MAAAGPSDEEAARSAWFRTYDRSLTVLDTGASALIIVAMAVLTCTIVLQVFFRYVLNSSLDWGWEVPRLCFIATIFLALPLGIRRGAHVGIDLLIDALPRGPRRGLFRALVALMAVLMLTVAYHAVLLAHQTWDQLMPTLNLSTGVFFVFLAISGVHSVLHLVRLFWLGEQTRAIAFDEQ